MFKKILKILIGIEKGNIDSIDGLKLIKQIIYERIFKQ